MLLRPTLRAGGENAVCAAFHLSKIPLQERDNIVIASRGVVFSNLLRQSLCSCSSLLGHDALCCCFPSMGERSWQLLTQPYCRSLLALQSTSRGKTTVVEFAVARSKLCCTERKCGVVVRLSAAAVLFLIPP